jgi:tryptophanase
MPELRSRIESKLSANGRGGNFWIIPSNSHFDTTQGNIEDKGMVPLNLPCREHLEGDELYPFRGNMDAEELDNLLEHEKDRVPLVYMTITNNTGGGQPVSISNIRKIRKITRKHGVPFFFDSCRFAENAWFIKKREDEFWDASIQQIVHEMFRYADGFHISLKKDGLVNMGGALVLRKDGDFTKKFPNFKEGITDHQIMAEGHPTYGGLPGRDLKAIAEGLRTVVHDEYLDARIGQVVRFGNALFEAGIPVIRPIGGHAVYIDLDRFFDGTAADDEFKGIALTALLLIAGHRVCELGLYAFGSYDGEKETPPEPRVNYVRAAVPRLTYEDRDLLSVVEALKVLADHRDMIPGVRVDYGRALSLRHFKSRFSFMG